MATKTSSYLPFARKYRPVKFSQLLGQEVLVKTLSYAIKQQRLAQGYLLTGIRGVGKTSSARIIAKTINCTDVKSDNKEITPCDVCKNCLEFNNGGHPDVMEIDAASNTGVDDVRKIINSSEYRPMLGKYKVFIIDEVHMLSKSAFNALLKIIEEPPPHVVFLLATTEIQKIPLTVISRCQRYDLRRLGFEEIYQMLENIAKQEKLEFSEEALKIISVKSEGSARDATSLLDQAASYSSNSKDKKITVELVNQMIGLVQSSTILEIIQLIIANNPKRAIDLIKEVYENSSNLKYFIQEIADFIADLSKTKVISNYSNPLYLNYEQEINTLLSGMSLSRLTILWQIFSNGVQELDASHNGLVTAEMLIIKAIYSCNLPSAEAITDTTAEDTKKIIFDSTDNNHLDSSRNNQIFEFLKYCHKNKEFPIYYLLLNEVEVQKFDQNIMELASNDNISDISKLKELLLGWSNNDWQVKTVKTEKISTLKAKMLKEVVASEDFMTIKNKFPNADISDIIFQNTQ